MKVLKYLLVILAGLFLFVACEKEFSLESGFAGKTATGSLLDSLGNCRDIVVNGAYFADSTLSDSNYVLVQVTIDSGGSYNIFTDTQNGFSFRDSGVIAAGTHTIKLKASGRPVTSKETIFQAVFDTSFCSFTVNVLSNKPASFTLTSSGTSCSSSTPSGNYIVGTALTANNTVTLAVNVTAPGSYVINTAAVNGFSFSGSGSFTTLGPQFVTLKGRGTPANPGTFPFPVTAGSSSCSFNITVAPAGNPSNTDPNLSDTAWSFTQGTRSFHGPFLDVFDTTANGVYSLVLVGYTAATGDSVLYFGSAFTGTTIQTGTTSTKTFAAFDFTDYRDTAHLAPIYTADPTTSAADTKITISSYDPATGLISGTFSGTAMNAANTPVPITNGRFKARVR